MHLPCAVLLKCNIEKLIFISINLKTQYQMRKKKKEGRLSVCVPY